MKSERMARIKSRARSLSLNGIIVALAVGVLLPVLLSTAVGIVTLALGENSDPIVVGVLVVSFAAAAVGSAITVTVLLGRRARIARLQTDLLANVSHDLRTPLTAIRMWAQTLQSGKLNGDPQRAAQGLQTIVRETDWLETAIDRILSWRAASRDRDTLELKQEPLGGAVDDAVQGFNRLLAPGEVDLTVSVESVTLVLHDRRAVAASVLNLLINAYKYTRAEKKITVSVRDRDKQVGIAVEDNGIGIAQRELQRIFDPFYRVDSRLKGRASGVGLGLAIVRHQTRSQRGEVLVESTEGQGSRFTILLPKANGSSQAP